MKKFLLLTLLMPGLLLAEGEAESSQEDPCIRNKDILTIQIMSLLGKSGTGLTGAQQWKKEVVSGNGKWRTNFLVVSHGIHKFFHPQTRPDEIPAHVSRNEYRGCLAKFKAAIVKFGSTPDEICRAQFEINRDGTSVTINGEVTNTYTTNLTGEEIEKIGKKPLGGSSEEQSEEQSDGFTRCSTRIKAQLDVRRRTLKNVVCQSCTTQINADQFEEMMRDKKKSEPREFHFN